MNACPDCDRPLAQSATSCVCNWKLPTPTHYEPPIKEMRKGKGPRLNWRQRWYLENKLPFEPPKLVQCPPFMLLGGSYMPPRQREPGDDDAELAA